MELKVGDRVRDNDPRMSGRERVVAEFAASRGSPFVTVARLAIRRGEEWEAEVRLDRIHTDGKPRRSGWSLVSTTPTPPA